MEKMQLDLQSKKFTKVGSGILLRMEPPVSEFALYIFCHYNQIFNLKFKISNDIVIK